MMKIKGNGNIVINSNNSIKNIKPRKFRFKRIVAVIAALATILLTLITLIEMHKDKKRDSLHRKENVLIEHRSEKPTKR